VFAVGLDGYECEPEVRRAWGTRDLEIRLVRGGTLTLRVTDGADVPIVHYSVRVLPRSRRQWGSDDGHVRASGRHENGTATVDGVTRGDWLLLVEFPAESGFDPLYEPFQQTADRPVRLDLRAGVAARRIARVLDADDRPVAGSVVQLCELLGGSLEHRMVLRRDLWLLNAGNGPALVVCEGTTDADGRVPLRGAAERTFGVNLLGPGHIPAQQSAVRLDVEGELVVHVQRGARLTGRVVPPEAVAELRRLAKADGNTFPAAYRPRLEL